MKRNQWATNKTRKSIPQNNEVWKALNGSIWVEDDVQYTMEQFNGIEGRTKYEITYNEEDGLFLVHCISDDYIEDKHLRFEDLIEEYDILPEYEQQLHNAIYVMQKTGYKPKEAEEIHMMKLQKQENLLNEMTRLYETRDTNLDEDDKRILQIVVDAQQKIAQNNSNKKED